MCNAFVCGDARNPRHPQDGSLIVHQLFGELLELRAADLILEGLEHCAQREDLAEIGGDTDLQVQGLAFRARSQLQFCQLVFLLGNCKPSRRGNDQSKSGYHKTQPGITIVPPACGRIPAPTDLVPISAHHSASFDTPPYLSSPAWSSPMSRAGPLVLECREAPARRHRHVVRWPPEAALACNPQNKRRAKAIVRIVAPKLRCRGSVANP